MIQVLHSFWKMDFEMNSKDFHFYGLGLRSRVYGLGLLSRVLLKDILLCLVGWHPDIICVLFVIPDFKPHTEHGQRLVKQ